MTTKDYDSLPPEEQPDVITGYLYKKCQNVLMGFKKRLVPDTGEFGYWKKKPNKGVAPETVMKLTQNDKIISLNDAKGFILDMGHMRLELKAENKQEKERWMEGLENVVEIQQLRAPEDEVKPLPFLDILKVKGYLDYIGNIDPKILNRRIMMGWIKKKSKSAMGMYIARWYILISSRPLRRDIEPDEKILTENWLPPKTELETIYYYDHQEILEDSGFLDMFALRNLVDIKAKNSKKSKIFKFKVDMGSRILKLATDTENERNLWITAMEMSKQTALQQKKSKRGLTKNVVPIVEMKDKQGVERLRKKLNVDYQTIKQDFPVLHEDSIEDLLRQNDYLMKDFISSVDALLAFEPPRKDIIEEYIEIFHKQIISSLTDYYKKHEIQNLGILNLINWLHKYHDELKTYGIIDERLLESCKVLAVIFAKRIFKTNIDMIFAILNQFKKAKPTTGPDGRVSTSGPIDLFKVLNETFEMYTRCSHHEIAEKLVDIIRDEIFYYINNLTVIMDKLEFTEDLYMGFSNDTLLYMKGLNDFIRSVNSFTDMEESKVEETVQREDIMRKFTEIGNKAFEKLVDTAFKDLANHFKVLFTDLDMEQVLSSIFDHLADIVNALHKSFSVKIWKLCLDKVILLHTQCLLNSAGKIKINDMEELNQKLRNERDLFKGAFKDVLGRSAIESSTRVIDEMCEFFEASPSFITVTVLTLRKSHGPDFNINTVSLLLKMRIDIDSNEKKNVLQACKEVLTKYKDPDGDKKFKSFFQKIEAEPTTEPNDDDDDEEEEEEEDDDDYSEKSHSDDEKENKNIVPEDKKEVVEEKQEALPEQINFKTFEGVLEKRSKKIITIWQSRFFAIKNYKLYWYINESAEKSQNSIDLIEIIGLEPKGELELIIQMKKKSHYLRMKSTEEREKWKQVLIMNIEDFKNEELKAKSDNQIYKKEGESLFDDKEPKWEPDPAKAEELVKREIPKAPEIKKPKEEEAKVDKNRRGSISFDDDIPEIPRKGEKKKKEKEKKQTLVEPPPQIIEEPPKQEVTATKIENTINNAYSSFLSFVGVKK